MELGIPLWKKCQPWVCNAMLVTVLIHLPHVHQVTSGGAGPLFWVLVTSPQLVPHSPPWQPLSCGAFNCYFC